jgi:enoyl-CoA hydratase
LSDTDAGRFGRIRYDVPAPGVARITLARADKHNAQDRKMLYDVDAGFTRAVRDEAIKVIVLAADGVNFSSGHDVTDLEQITNFDTVTLAGSFTEAGGHGRMTVEEEIYLGMCWRWRNLPKPTIAAVQGKVIAGGLMLIWPCDIVIASEEATFADPVVAFGVNGHEFFTHVWEVGHRLAREMLFRGHALSAAQCHTRGMVNHVVPRDELEARTLQIASEIAARPAIGLKLAKMAVNQSLDAQGQWNALQAAFGLHQFGHTFAETQFGIPVDPSGFDVIRALSKSDSAAGNGESSSKQTIETEVQ